MAEYKIKAARVGNVATLVIDGVKMSKQVTKEEWLTVSGKVTTYNTKNNKKLLDEIKLLMQKVKVEKAKAVEKELVQAKGEKKLVQKQLKEEKVVNKEQEVLTKELSAAAMAVEHIETNDYTDADVKKLEELIAKVRKVAKPQPTTGYKRGGEY